MIPNFNYIAPAGEKLRFRVILKSGADIIFDCSSFAVVSNPETNEADWNINNSSANTIIYIEPGEVASITMLNDKN